MAVTVLISQCRHVNKKALDQYLNFTEQRAELVRRHDETVRGKQKIQQLIQTLDLRKDEAIERTFKVKIDAKCALHVQLLWCLRLQCGGLLCTNDDLDSLNQAWQSDSSTANSQALLAAFTRNDCLDVSTFFQCSTNLVIGW